MIIMRVGVYAGSLDPITLGHIDIIKRALSLVDHLYVAVGFNPKKVASRLFTPDQSVELTRGALDYEFYDAVRWPDRNQIAPKRSRIDVVKLDGLLVDFANSHDITHIFRGLRAAADFNAEFEMHGVNHGLAPHIQTVFLMALPEFLYVSSSTIKEIASHRNPSQATEAVLRKYVTPNVEEALMKKLHN